MSDLVGTPEDMFSHKAPLESENVVALILVLSGLVLIKKGSP